MKAAAEIREVVQAYLRTSPEDARSQLPADWAPLLPLEIGAWSLHVEGDQAHLDHHPPGSTNAHHRLWFRIQVERKGGGWEIVPPGVAFVHAWARGPKA